MSTVEWPVKWDTSTQIRRHPYDSHNTAMNISLKWVCLLQITDGGFQWFLQFHLWQYLLDAIFETEQNENKIRFIKFICHIQWNLMCSKISRGQHIKPNKGRAVSGIFIWCQGIPLPAPFNYLDVIKRTIYVFMFFQFHFSPKRVDTRTVPITYSLSWPTLHAESLSWGMFHWP